MSNRSFRLFRPFALLAPLVSLGCAGLIGLDGYESDPNGSGGSDTGSGGATGGATTTGGANTGGATTTGGANTGGAVGGSDTGGSATGGAGTGGGVSCSTGCDDGIDCTVDACVDNSCEHTADDTLCPTAGDSCLPATCGEATGCLGDVVLIDATTNDGGFEVGLKPNTAWDEVGGYWVVSNCNGGNCNGSAGTTTPKTGLQMAWLGGIAGDDTYMSQVVTLPATTQSVRVRADTNFQTDNISASNTDTLDVTLDDLSNSALATFASFSNQNAKTSSPVWVTNGINSSIDATAWAGDSVRIAFHPQLDANGQLTDFFIDNVRLTATACK